MIVTGGTWQTTRRTQGQATGGARPVPAVSDAQGRSMRSLLTELSFLFPFHGTSGSLPHPPHLIPFFHDWLTHVFQTVPFRLAPQPVYTGQDLRGLPPIPSCMDASGQQAIRAPRKDTHIATHTYAESIWEGYSPTYLLDSLYHFLDVGVVNLSLEPVDIIGVL